MFLLLSICCVLALIPAVLTAWNSALLRRPEASSSQIGLVSVLIPARDEACNIARAVESVLANRNVDLELIVLDDHSTDSTADIVSEIALREPRLRLLRGRALPRGWCGKPFACQQLAEAARGDTLIFMDADVRLSSQAVAQLAGSRRAMLSGLPFQVTKGAAESAIVPLMYFVLLGYLPMALMRRHTYPALGAACGQLIAVDREAYWACGGHASVADKVHDGIALARQFRRRSYLTDLADFTEVARCRMYRSCREVFDGFAKNSHEGLGSPKGIVPWTLILLLGQSLPVLLLPFVWDDPPLRGLAAIAIGLALLTRVLIALRFGQKKFWVPTHPYAVVALVLIQWYAALRRLMKRPVKWKQRSLTAS